MKDEKIDRLLRSAARAREQADAERRVHEKRTTFAAEAMQQLTADTSISATLIRDMVVIAGCTVLALALGAATLRRRTP